jgi:hypothetical protein
MRGLDRTRREPADALRELELERLDALQVQLTRVLGRVHVTVSGGKIVTDPDGRPLVDDGPTVAAAQALVRVGESRRRLLGLDAPAQVEAKVWTVDQMDARIGELETLLAADDPEWGQREQARASQALAADRFRLAWSRPGLVAGDPAGFVAEGLALLLDSLDLDDQAREVAAAAVEQALSVGVGR